MIEAPGNAAHPAAERPQPQGAAGYASGRAVERVAAVTASRYAPDTLDEMRRLDAFLRSGQTVRNDVPRGFYFNALV